ncbi:hypothetical protein [Aurantimonas endophytica]|uniref:Uncharacterized protein n=1 Tax=Aurantimonas endophytica TaxID=1522175 RepID=A0A7W6HDB8_9HYPH|nr:hypothetical protein [Aurantimonas endophytica]MBB4003111.1 hypothetical protein [Aurantimonas endophytica]MCO6403983.1 hypothetical protein [Aurantimonas endophytica]
MSHAEAFSAELAAASPLVINFVLSPQLTISTTVTGDARQNATVSLVNGSVALWSTTLTQFTPTAEIPYDIVGGQLTIKKGGSFTLTIPTSGQAGSVVASLTVVTPTAPQGIPFNATVASWTLSSSSTS